MTIPAGEPRALAAIRRGRVLPILWLRDHGRAVEIAEALADAGVQALEITLGDPAAQQSIAAVVKAVGDRVPVGAGTVLDREEPRRLAALGVEFCVSPHTDPALVEAALTAGLVPLPGTYTATEVTVALAAVPTGGIAIDEVPAWLAAGAIAVGLGSDLVPASGALDGLQERAARAV